MIRTSIRRPVAVAMAYLAVALLGVAAWRNIPIELLPDTRLPRLTVRGTWPGASPETVEAFLTSPAEATVQLVAGVEKIRSESYEDQGLGISEIEVEFNRDTDMDFVRLDLSERLSTLEEDLPPGVERLSVEPYVPEEFESQAERAFLRYTFTGPHTLEALRSWLDDEVVPAVSQLDGVALVQASGGRERLVEIELDEPRILALGLSPAVIAQRVADLDLVREAGAVRSGDREWTVTIENRPGSVQDVRGAVVTGSGDRLVRLADVATVRDTYEKARSHYRIDGRPAVAFVVVKEIGANTVGVADRVKEEVGSLEDRGPVGTRFILDEDESEEIRKQLTDLRFRAFVSAIVVLAVLILFLQSFRSAGIVFATIAFSILISLNLIYFGGLSLNLLTLMGLAMGFGLIVDNSIVVLENVYRRWQGGDTPVHAAEVGARQVVLPILASTATTLIVFVPFVYLQGELRVFYVPLAIVVGLTLLASLFVAFTFIPSLAARILGPGGGSGVVAATTSPATGAGAPGARRPEPTASADPLATPPDGPHPAGSSREPGPGSPLRRPLYVRFYSALVGFTLRHPIAAVAVAVLSLAGSWYLFDRYVTRGVVWGRGFGQDTYIAIQIRLPRGSDLDRTDELVRFFEGKLARLPEVDRFVSQVGGTFGFIRVTFPDSLENTAVPPAIKEQMVAYSLGFSGAEVRVYGYGPSFYGGGGGAPNYSIKVLGYNYERVREIAEDLGSRLRRFSRVRDVDTNSSGRWFQQDRATEYVVSVDRAALSRYDVTVEELVRRIGAAVGGEVQRSWMKLGGDEVRYDVKLEGYDDRDVVALKETVFTTGSGAGIRLGDVVAIAPKEVLSRIRREDQQYERTVAYEFRGPVKLGDVYLDAVIASTSVPPGYSVEQTEAFFRWTDEERSQIYLVLALSIVLVFMVTAALFESLRQPFCVLLTVPMALIGVFLIFFYARATFTREAYIGVIMMGGIVVNNAILLVDHINQVRRETDLPLDRAILQGTLERVRPILMTTMTTVLGLLPLVLFTETADATIWNALGFALIGGLLSSTLFVLTTTPALYLLFERGPASRAVESDAGSPGDRTPTLTPGSGPLHSPA